MIKTILAWTAAAMVFALVMLLFINGGGLRSIRDTAGSVPSLRDFIFGIASSSTQFQLPGQEDVGYNLGIDPDFGEDGGGATVGSSASSGSQSVVIETDGVSATSASDEYVVLYASSANSAPIDISGWSVVSAQTGSRMVVPLATTLFTPGSPSKVQGVALAPGSRALLYTGVSPVGVSYRENACTDFLGHMPAYSACVSAQQSEPGFQSNSWRLYAAFANEVWFERDTLRLFDGQGRLVDEASY